jgi:hypothetical protein
MVELITRIKPISMLMDRILLQDFVTPALAYKLHLLGLSVPPEFPYQWRIRKNTNEEAELTCKAFDIDKYYSAAIAMLDNVESVFYVPGFRFTDLEHLIPDFLLTRNNIEYELCSSTLFSLQLQKDKHIPDVFAKMVIHGIGEKVFEVNSLNEKLHQVSNERGRIF